MRKRGRTPDACVLPDVDSIRDGLCSPDPRTRARAVRSVCPCRLGWGTFEALMPFVEALRKDPDDEVRANALHVFQDGYEMEGAGAQTSRKMATNEMARARFKGRWGGEYAGSRRTRGDRRARHTC